jgi:hypothetical protein
MEIERLVIKYGAKQFVSGFDTTPGYERALIEFSMKDRRVRFKLPLSKKESFARNSRGSRRSAGQAHAAWEADNRQRWRALLLVIKAKLEAVEQDIVTFEEEFLNHIVMPNGRTVGEEVVPHIAAAYEKKEMPPLLAWAGD